MNEWSIVESVNAFISLFKCLNYSLLSYVAYFMCFEIEARFSKADTSDFYVEIVISCWYICSNLVVR